MAVVTGHTCNATGFYGSKPKEERQRDCPACQRQSLYAKGRGTDKPKAPLMPEPTNQELLRQACEDVLLDCPPDYDDITLNPEYNIARALLSRLDREAEAERELREYKEWRQAARQFAWSHEKTCPRHDADERCNCGLDSFLSRPRPFVESYKNQLAEAERRADELRALKPGWDLDGAPVICEAAIRAALKFLGGSMRMTPCSSGGVQIDGQGAEIVFGADGEQEFDWSNRLAEAERLLKVAREAIEQAKNDFDTIAYAHSSKADFQTQETLRENWQHTFDHAWNSRARCEDALAEIAPAAPEGEKP